MQPKLCFTKLHVYPFLTFNIFQLAIKCVRPQEYVKRQKGYIIREAIRKKRLSFGHCPKKGGGSTGIQKFGDSFVFPSFGHEMGGGRGVGHVPKVVRHFLPKYWVNI